MRLFRPCFIAGWLYPEAIFRIKTDEKLLYLTFDDGPDPDSTPELINILDKFSIKGLFFCDGNAAGKYPELIGLILSKGHIIGNHGFMHYDGWRTSTDKYLADASKAERFTGSMFFRPPYGRMKIGQYRKLKEVYKIVMWDIMPYDFDAKMSIQSSLQVLKKKIRPGSIIVMHDKPASAANRIIGELITYAVSSGYRFGVPGKDTPWHDLSTPEIKLLPRRPVQTSNLPFLREEDQEPGRDFHENN
jgi:peptidoglycan/xylan/chitin deacetylase (PgdA/CDA1 family)